MPPPGHDRFLLAFAPEQWTPIDRFRKFFGSPFKSSRPLTLAMNACSGHIQKFSILASLANRLQQGLSEDEQELRREGYSPVLRSQEYAAVVESLVCELYAALDGLRGALHYIYRDVQGIQNKSTKKLFEKAQAHSYGVGFPEEINRLLAQAGNSWFPRLRTLRTELTHGGVGSCHKNKDSQKIFYMHEGLGDSQRAYVVDDITAEVNTFARGALGLIQDIFNILYSQLDQNESFQVCGIYKGRIFQRMAAPEVPPKNTMGRCHSFSWFENEAGFECPLRAKCSAYKRAIHSSS